MSRQTEIRNINHENRMSKRIIISIFVIVEAVLAFRLIFKLLGANSENGFVRGIYSVTESLIYIFKGIFSHVEMDTTGVLEPETIISMILIAIIAWVILKLIRPRADERREKTEYTKIDEENK